MCFRRRLDPSGHGVVSCEIYHGRRYGIRAGRRVRAVHEQCTSTFFSFLSTYLFLTAVYRNEQMSYDTPLTPQGRELSTLSTREQIRRGFKDMGSRSYSSAKNFAIVGALFSGTECCIEGLRAKNDLANGVAAGCITGGILGAQAGPQAALLGCAGFAAFSAAIDAYMRQPSD